MAANKSDLIGGKKEEVNEEEARKYAQDIGAIFQLTSAFTGTGIDLLFKNIANKMIYPNYMEKTNKKRISYKNNGDIDDDIINHNDNKNSSIEKKISLDKEKPKKKKKKNC